jgi:mRNA export factor
MFGNNRSRDLWHSIVQSNLHRDYNLYLATVLFVSRKMAFFGNTSTTGGVGAAGNTSSSAADKDIEVADPPTDSISSISFSSQADYMAVGSWDNSVRSQELLSDLLTVYLSQGANLRSRRCWTNPGQGNVSAPRSGFGCMLE